MDHAGDPVVRFSSYPSCDMADGPPRCSYEPGNSAVSSMQRDLDLATRKAAHGNHWRRLQAALEAAAKQEGEARPAKQGQRHTAIRAWDSIDGWMAAFQEAACNWPWMGDPESARLVAAAEDYGRCCAEVEAATKEMWLPPGWTFPDVAPVLQVEEAQPEDQFAELWISPSVPEEVMLRLVRHARVGVHLVAVAALGSG